MKNRTKRKNIPPPKKKKIIIIKKPTIGLSAHIHRNKKKEEMYSIILLEIVSVIINGLLFFTCLLKVLYSVVLRVSGNELCRQRVFYMLIRLGSVLRFLPRSPA